MPLRLVRFAAFTLRHPRDYGRGSDATSASLNVLP
jgi:hypothetical protein